MLDLLIKALRYKIWADQTILQAVQALPDGSSNAAFAHQQLHHIVLVQELFLARLQGTNDPHTATNSTPVPGLSELTQRLLAANDRLLAYYSTADEQQLGQVIRFVFSDGQRGSLSRAEILFHLINHASYHRGAIGHTLDLAGVHRPADTYTVFVHASEPQRRE
jgi:uncharacterized damage-inducible protein DinB